MVGIYFRKLKAISKMIVKTPISARINKESAIVSSRFSSFSLDVLIEVNEKMQEKVNSTAMKEVNSSIICVSVRLAICNDVITKRQNPKRFAEAFRMCCEVLFAILLKVNS